MTGVPPDSLGVQKSRLEEKNSVEIIFAAGRCRFGLRFLFFSVFFCLVWPEKIAAHQHKKCDGRFANRHAFLFLFSTFRFFFAPTLLLLLFLLLHLPSFFFTVSPFRLTPRRRPTQWTPKNVSFPFSNNSSRLSHIVHFVTKETHGKTPKIPLETR